MNKYIRNTLTKIKLNVYALTYFASIIYVKFLVCGCIVFPSEMIVSEIWTIFQLFFVVEYCNPHKYVIPTNNINFIADFGYFKIGTLFQNRVTIFLNFHFVIILRVFYRYSSYLLQQVVIWNIGFRKH